MKKLVIVIVIGAVVYFGYKWRLNNEFSDANLAEAVVIQSKKMGLPKNDGLLTLDSFTAEPGKKLFVTAHSNFSPASDFDVNKLRGTKSVLTGPLCKDPWVRLALQHGVTATYQFYGNDDNLVIEVVVTKEDCGS